MSQQTPNNKGSPLLLSKSILARDSILKRLDACQKDFGDERTKESQLYQQLERRIEISKGKHLEELKALDMVSVF
jgi:hypothetical protein